MAIYKLKDFVNLNKAYNKSDSIDYLELSGIQNFKTKSITRNEIPSRAKWNIDKNTIIIGRVRPDNKNHNYYIGNKQLVGSSGFTCFKSNNKKINNKYLWYVLQRSSFTNFTIDNAKGSTYPEISQTDLLNFKHYYPSLEYQQEIIDIIKPIEKTIQLIEKMFNTIEKQEKSLLHFSSITKQPFNFDKGKSPSNDGKTLFLNVAAANDNPNRFVANDPNIFIRDITLSLDGNCGIVNNALIGYNGYLYKVTANNIDSWQVYYSLKTDVSQQIIKLNETGTTIRHAPGAKKELRVFNFKTSRELEFLFNKKITLKIIKDKLDKILQNKIKLLIK